MARNPNTWARPLGDAAKAAEATAAEAAATAEGKKLSFETLKGARDAQSATASARLGPDLATQTPKPGLRATPSSRMQELLQRPAAAAAEEAGAVSKSNAKVWAKDPRLQAALERGPTPAPAPATAAGAPPAPPGATPPPAAAAEGAAPRGRIGTVFDKIKTAKIPGANAARGVANAGGKVLGAGRIATGLIGGAASDAAMVYGGAQIGSHAGNVVARMAGMREEDIADADHRLHQKTYGILGKERAPTPEMAPDPLKGKLVDDATIASWELDQKARETAPMSGYLADPRPATAPAAPQALGDGRIQTPADLAGSGPVSRERGNTNSLWGAINEINAQRFDDKRKRSWFDAQTKQDGVEVAREAAKSTAATARARLGLDSQKLYEEHQQTAAKNMNEEMDRWATEVDPKTGKSGVNPTLRNELNTFMTEALTGPDGRPDPNLTRDPTIMQRMMPQVVAALQQGAKVKDLAKNPGFIRSITDFVGATMPARTTDGDYGIKDMRRAGFGDWATNRGVSFRNAVAGTPVTETDTGVVLPTSDLADNNVQKMQAIVRRMASGMNDPALERANRVGAISPEMQARIQRMRAGQ